MRQPKVTFAALLLAAVLAACGSDDSSKSDPAQPKESPTAAQASNGETIPDGSYAKTVTVADAEEAGITDQGFLGSNFGDDGSSTFTFKFGGDRWTQFVAPSDGAPEPGDLGSLTYDGNGDVVMTSESEGCPGCTFVYDWQLDGDELTLTIVEPESSDPIVRFVTEGQFVRQS
jgi:hypothetical protein